MHHNNNTSLPSSALEQLQKLQHTIITPTPRHPYHELISNIPHFWLRALTNHPGLSPHLTAYDARLLQHLTDISVTTHTANSFTLSFTFQPNPHFSTLHLTKSYLQSDHGRSVSTPSIVWTQRPKSPVPQPSRFFTWLSRDAEDIFQIGELIRRDLIPRSVQLFFDRYFTPYPSHIPE